MTKFTCTKKVEDADGCKSDCHFVVETDSPDTTIIHLNTCENEGYSIITHIVLDRHQIPFT
jgi:hypothetical protein